MLFTSWRASAAVLSGLLAVGAAVFLACSSGSDSGSTGGGGGFDAACPACVASGTLPDGAAFPPSGTLDTTFAGGKGSAFLKYPGTGGTNQVFGRIGVMRDGSLLIGMPSDGPTNGSNGITLGHYTADGLPFPGFGSRKDGSLTLDLPGYPSDFAIAADDSILIVGNAAKSVFVSRFHADGTMDTSFGQGGNSVFDLGAAGVESYATSLVPQPDGGMLIIGSSTGPGVVRLDASGVLDAAFGKQTRPDGVYTANGEVILQFAANGSFVFADLTATVHVATPNGEPDPAFGAPIPLADAYEQTCAVAPFVGGAITAGWVAVVDGGATAMAVQREPGKPNRLFAAGAGLSGPYAASTLPVIGGKVLVGGGASYRTGSSQVWATELLPDGGADPVFEANALGDGGPGALASGRILYLDALRNDSAGRVLVAGLATGYGGIALARIYP